MATGFFSRVLRLKAHLSAARWDERNVFLVGEDQQFLVTGRACALVLPEVDGVRTVSAIASALDGKVSASEVAYALMTLEERGYVTDANSTAPTPSDGFWSALGLDPSQANGHIAGATIAIEGPHAGDTFALRRALADAGLRVGEPAALRVVVTDDYLSAEVERAHSTAGNAPMPWTIVKPRGRTAWVGPIFSPRGACWACLASRLRHNRPVAAYFQRHGRGPPQPPMVSVTASVEGALRWSALAIVRWVAAGLAGPIDTSLLSLDGDTCSTSAHRVVRRPQCASCGDPGLYTRRAEAPILLRSVSRPVTDDGGYRAHSPDETFRRLAHHVSPYTGVLASLEPMPGRADPLRPTFAATYRVCPVAESPSPNGFHRHGYGKGRTAAQARASALCEALERQSAVMQGDEPRIEARFFDLGEDAIHPDRIQNFSAAQQSAFGDAPSADPRQRVARSFDERAAIEWTPAWSLARERKLWLPLAYCYSDVPASPGPASCLFNPNGHAAGNYLEEAILQGLLELVERDAVAVWWYNRIARPAVDLDTFGVPYFAALRSSYEALGWSMWVLDLTHDLRIPAFVALARSGASGPFAVGFGCHLDARLGVQRALTELNQLFDPAASRSPWGESEGSAESHPYLFPSGARPTVCADFPVAEALDLRRDVLACVARLAEAGLETLVIDQTRPDVELSVAKVVVPGLRHFWPRLGPGRLYDVPVACGWLPRALTESELNPLPLFL